ncbi:MAG TPA: hypothetical protein VF725_12075 [Ktedonobacterales bacterium]
MSERHPALSERLELKYWLFRALAAIIPRLPRWLAERLAIVGGALAWATVAPLRRRAERNLAHIPALAADPARLRQTTRHVFTHLALNYVDFFRAPHISDQELAQDWRIDGWDTFERAIRDGLGAVVMGAHLGPFEYASAKIGELGVPLLTPAERLRPERLFQFVSHLRDHHQARMLPGDDRETLRTIINSLRAGNMALFAVDRWVMGPSDEWPFFGEPAHLPTAPFALAARSDAPVFLIVPWRISLREFGATVQLITPERMPPDNAHDGAAPAQRAAEERRPRDREAAIAAMRARVYPALERIIAAHPEQWVGALSVIWDTAPELAHAISAREEQTTPAATAARPARPPAGAQTAASKN